MSKIRTLVMIIAVVIVGGSLAVRSRAQDSKPQIVSIKAIAPEDAPVGVCAEHPDPSSGYVGIIDGKAAYFYSTDSSSENYDVSDAQLGAFAKEMLSHGNTVTFTPQPGGRIFANVDCQSRVQKGK